MRSKRCSATTRPPMFGRSPSPTRADRLIESLQAVATTMHTSVTPRIDLGQQRPANTYPSPARQSQDAALSQDRCRELQLLSDRRDKRTVNHIYQCVTAP